MSCFPRSATEFALWTLMCATFQSTIALSAQVPSGLQELHLAVIINNVPTNLAGTFFISADGRFFARPSELRELGIKPPTADDGDTPIELGAASTIGYRYDALSQSIHVSLSDERRETKAYDASMSSPQQLAASRHFGAVLNYNAFATAADDDFSRLSRFSSSAAGISLSLDARIFGSFGTLASTAIVGSGVGAGDKALRLETNWSLSDQTSMMTYRVGDTIAGGVSWSRPYRLAGAQVQRNFGLRSDLITAPLPSFSGSAAVPSVVDVYINGMKTYSQDVGAGPFQLNSVPVIGGSGEARVVVRDSSGREVETRRSFFTSPQLLRPGLTDFTIEAGLPRIGYGISSNDYLSTPVASGSARHGIYDWLTLEAHAEAGGSLASLGGGSVVKIGNLGTLSVGSQVSLDSGRYGFLGYAALDLQIGEIGLHASTQRTSSDYSDIVSSTANKGIQYRWDSGADHTASLLTTRHARPPKALDTLSIGIPLKFDASTLALSLIHLEPAEGVTSDIVNISYNRPVFSTGAFFVSAYSDLRNRSNSGIIAGVSFPLGGAATATVSASRNGNSNAISVDATKPLGNEPGSYGWRVRDAEGDSAYRSASVAYRGQSARVEGRVEQGKRTARASLEVEGAFAVLGGGGVHMSNRIDDGFAIVAAGAPNVDVQYENRRIGKTRGDGTLLVPNLRSFQTNRIDIDVTTLPADADVGKTTIIASPADRGGALVDFKPKSTGRSAIITVRRADGRFPAAGSVARLSGGAAEGVVGYDGQIFLTGLADVNEMVVSNVDGDCRVSFGIPKSSSGQAKLGPLTCQ
jgi:outer membrane usher protein